MAKQNIYTDLEIFNGLFGSAVISLNEESDNLTINPTTSQLRIGSKAYTDSDNAIAIGKNSNTTAINTVALNSSGDVVINSEANTFKYYGTNDTEDVAFGASVARFRKLAGIGTRNVVADSAGNLIASTIPVSKMMTTVSMTAETPFRITHNLNTLGISVTVFDSTGRIIVPAVVYDRTLNTVSIIVVLTGNYDVVVIG